MVGLSAPLLAHRRLVLLKFEGDYQVAFDGTGYQAQVSLDSRDGEIEFRDADRLRAIAGALKCGARLIEAAGPPLTLLHWRRLNT